MLLALDVGNTNITLGVFDEDKLLFSHRRDQGRTGRMGAGMILTGGRPKGA